VSKIEDFHEDFFKVKNELLENIKFVLVLLYGGLTLLSFTLLINPIKPTKRPTYFSGCFFYLWSAIGYLDVLHICGINPEPWFHFSLFYTDVYALSFCFPVLYFY
jgi:hypothetical protein